MANSEQVKNSGLGRSLLGMMSTTAMHELQAKPNPRNLGRVLTNIEAELRAGLGMPRATPNRTLIKPPAGGGSYVPEPTIGAKIEARWSGDGEYYHARVVEVGRKFTVEWVDGTQDKVSRNDIKIN